MKKSTDTGYDEAWAEVLEQCVSVDANQLLGISEPKGSDPEVCHSVQRWIEEVGNI